MNIGDLTYRQVIESLFKDCPKDITWVDEGDWLRKTYPKEHLAGVYKSLYKDLCTICDIDNEHPEADYLRDYLDPIWLAGDDSLYKEMTYEVLKERGEI
jgi:hypothetical protein